MNRNVWLKYMRKESEARYDALWAPLYGEKFSMDVDVLPQKLIRDFLNLLPPDSAILDAACGAGRFLPLLLEHGHAITAADQSQGMLDRARENFPGLRFEKVGLQEMRYESAFDGVICMEAMENISPEDWPLVVANFQRALKTQGYLYFSLEIADQNELKAAFERAQQAGFPVVFGEWAGEWAYHYYPSLPQVREWLEGAGFVMVKEVEEGDYRHFIVQNPGKGQSAKETS